MKKYFIRGNKLILKDGADIRNSVVLEGELDNVIRRCKLKGFNNIFLTESDKKKLDMVNKKEVLSNGRRKIL